MTGQQTTPKVRWWSDIVVKERAGLYIAGPHPEPTASDIYSTMTTELVAHMRLPHYKFLWQALYGSAHGFGERKLKLNLTSGQSGFVIEMPIVCHFEDNVPTLSTQGVSKSEWSTLCKFVSDEKVLKVILFDHTHDLLARVTSVGAKPPKTDLYQVKFRWQENDEVALALRKGIKWITEILE